MFDYLIPRLQSFCTLPRLLTGLISRNDLILLISVFEDTALNQGLAVIPGMVNQAIFEKAIMAVHDW